MDQFHSTILPRTQQRVGHSYGHWLVNSCWSCATSGSSEHDITMATANVNFIYTVNELVSFPDPPGKIEKGSGNTYGNAVSTRAIYSRQSDCRNHVRHVQSRMCKLIGIQRPSWRSVDKAVEVSRVRIRYGTLIPKH